MIGNVGDLIQFINKLIVYIKTLEEFDENFLDIKNEVLSISDALQKYELPASLSDNKIWNVVTSTFKKIEAFLIKLDRHKTYYKYVWPGYVKTELETFRHRLNFQFQTFVLSLQAPGLLQPSNPNSMIEDVTTDVALMLKQVMLESVSEERVIKKIVAHARKGHFVRAMQPQMFCCTSAEKLKNKGIELRGKHKIRQSIVQFLKCRQCLIQSGSMEDIKQSVEMFYQIGNLYLKCASRQNNDGGIFGTLALEAFLKGDKIRKSICKGNHEIRFKLKRGLAEANILLGEYQKALDCYNCSIESLKDFFGNDHVAVAEELHNKASVYESMENFENAKDVLLESLAIKNRIDGGRNICIVNTSMALVHLYFFSERFKTEPELLNEALKYCLNSYGVLKTAKRLAEQNGCVFGFQYKKNLKDCCCMTSTIYELMGNKRLCESFRDEFNNINIIEASRESPTTENPMVEVTRPSESDSETDDD